MSSKRIADLPVKNPTDAMKIPTGGFGDYAVTLKSISEWLVNKYSLATKEELKLVDNTLKSLIELKADKTSVYTKQEVDNIVQQAKERLEQSIQLTDSRVGSLETTVDSNYQTLSQNKADKNNVVNSVGGRKGDITYQQIKDGLNLGDLASKNEAETLVDSNLKTWSGRSQEQKNKDSIHVLDFKTASKTDQQAIQDAVNYCLANGRTLDWEGAHLTSTANIINFWSVEHKGQGSVTRNGHKFFISPILAQASEIYLKAGALTVNDGLSPDTPTTPTSAFKYLSSLKDRVSEGTWRVRIIGSIDLAGVTVTSLPAFKNRLEIIGEDVASKAEPISSWSGVNTTSYALNFSKCPIKLLIKNLKFVDWLRDDGNSGGVVVDLDSDILVENCRFTNMNIGLWAQKSYMKVQNSVFTNINTFACYSSYNGYANIGTLGNGNIFDNCVTGVASARSAVTYVTGNTFKNIRQRGIWINKNARARDQGNTWVNFVDGASPLQCAILCEEGGIYNNDNNSGNPAKFDPAFIVTSDRPYLNMCSGAEYFVYTPKNGAGIHFTSSPITPITINNDDQNNLNTLFNDRILSLPSHALYAEEFKIRIELLCSMSANTSYNFSLYGAGSSSALNFGTVTIPAQTELKSFKLSVEYTKSKGRDTVFSVADAHQLGLFSAVGTNNTVLNQALVRSPSESVLIYRPYVQRVSGTGSLIINSIRVYIEI